MNKMYSRALENIQNSKYEDSIRLPHGWKLRLSNKYSKKAYFHNYITNKSVWTRKKAIKCENQKRKKKYCKPQHKLNCVNKRRRKNSISVNSSLSNIVNSLTDSNNESTVDLVVSKINKKQSHNNDFEDIDNNLLNKCKNEEYERSFCDTVIGPLSQFCRNKQNNFTYFPFIAYSTNSILPSCSSNKINNKLRHASVNCSNRNNHTTGLSNATDNSSVEAWLESLSNENMSILSGNEVIEQMDWEISHEDRIVVHDIKHLRSQINRRLFSNFKSPNIESSNDTFEGCNLFIVIDTNILISHLSFIDELLNCSLPGYNKSCMIIPWIVVQELDLLKNSRGLSQDQKLLSEKAKQAISFLYGNFSSGHPRLRGQSTFDFCQSETFLSQSNDDSIIQCCLQMASHSSSILLSNDKTLCTKAIMLGLCAMTKERLQKEIEQCSHKKISTEMLLNSDSDMPIICSNNHSIEKIHFSFTEILKEVLSQVIEVEMQLAYGELWNLVLKIKPPWTCLSTLKLIDLHWIAVFGLILPHKVKLLCNILLEKLKNNIHVQNKLEELKEIFSCLQELINLLGKRSCYDGVLQAAEKSLKSLYTHCNLAQNSMNEPFQETPTELEILAVYTVLELIWKYMTDMCHQVFNSTNNSYVNDSLPQQKCLQILPHLCKSCHTFCILFSQILCTNPNELSSNHTLVTELTSVLMGFFPSIDEQYIHNGILIQPKQVSLFCMDFKSRSMLNVAMQKLRSLKLEIISCYKKLKSDEMK